MMGTSAMYEYAATAMAPRRSGARREVSQIAVGPSAPPMMPIALASLIPKPRSANIDERPRAPNRAKKMPSCAAPPSNADFGFAISGPKSVMAPTPMKIMIGNTPVSIPKRKK